MPKRILLIDDHEMLRDAVTGTLNTLEGGCEIHGMGTGNAALNWVDRFGAPDLVLLDIELPDGSGLEFLKQLLQRHPALRVAMLSGNDDTASIQAAMSAGAAGFITKALSAASLVARVNEIMNGIQSITTAKAQTGAGPQTVEQRYGLTKMQVKVFELLLQGKRNREIAEQLEIAEGTVKAHTSAIFKALNVDSRALLLTKAHQEGLA